MPDDGPGGRPHPTRIVPDMLSDAHALRSTTPPPVSGGGVFVSTNTTNPKGETR